MPSKHMLSFVSIEARLKNFGVMLTAVAPDQNEVPCFIEGVDIRQQYGMNPAAFIEKHGEDESVLYDLFRSVYGISYAD